MRRSRLGEIFRESTPILGFEVVKIEYARLKFVRIGVAKVIMALLSAKIPKWSEQIIK